MAAFVMGSEKIIGCLGDVNLNWNEDSETKK
jgi:hypothetical protein